MEVCAEMPLTSSISMPMAISKVDLSKLKIWTDPVLIWRILINKVAIKRNTFRTHEIITVKALRLN